MWGRMTARAFRDHSGPLHRNTAYHTAPLWAEWLTYSCPYAPQKIGHAFYKVHANSSILLFFFLTAEIDVPHTLNRTIRYSVPQH